MITTWLLTFLLAVSGRWVNHQIPIDQVQPFTWTHTQTIDGVTVTIHGMYSPLQVLKGGGPEIYDVALTTREIVCGKDRPFIRLTFDPAVSVVGAWMMSDPGYEHEPPIMDCKGVNRRNGHTIEYAFGPGTYYASFNDAAYDYTPGNNNSYYWTSCDLLQGTWWALDFMIEE